MARPREFETQEALDAVMDVFWRKGFDGTSMHDIEAATGLNKQSLYRVFNDKRGMYLAALKRYDEQEVGAAAQILAGPGAPRARFRRLFEAALAPVLQDGDRSGCFLCNASADQGQLDRKTQNFVGAAMERVRQAFESSLAESPAYARKTQTRKALAAKLLAGYFGLRVLVRANVDEKTLIATADALLADIG
jgi:TetR/AcrR family transcriptional repressor of nem operon